MLSVQTGQIIANISVDIRLAIPISELYRLFLERHPTERRHIEQLSAQRVVEAASVKELATNLDKARTSVAGEDESRLYNELDIIIHRAAGLPMSSDGKPPTAYTHFQLLGHPDKFTIAVPNSNDPEFSEKFTFPAVTNDQQLRLMERSKLQVSVIDMKGEELDDKNQGLLGDIFISLAPLTDGSSIMDTFVVKNEHGNKVGELSLTMKWKYPLKKQRELGPRALSGLEVETLITAFCPGDFNEGVVDYQAFSRFADPPKGVLTTMDKLRVYCREISETQGKTSRDVFNILLDEGKPVDEDRFVERILRTQVDILPADCVSLFKFIDIDGENVITLDRFLAILNLDEIAGIAPGLQMKIRERVRDLNDRGIRVVSFFKLEDQWGVNGLVTRSEFKKVLKKMGFTLADEPDPVMGIVGVDEEGNKIIPSRKVEPVDDILNDTIGSEDDVLIPQGDMVPSSSNVTKNKDLSNFMKEQRAIFEEKKNDLQKRQQQALELESQLQSEKDDHKGVQNRNLDLYENDADHRIAISRSLPVERSFDLEVTISSATKLQSRFRGYSARKRFSETKVQKNLSKSPAFASSNDAQMSRAGSVKVSPTAILKAEDSIRSSLHNQSPPDILAAFLKLDKKRQGFVNRAQFAHVMKQFPIVGLYGEDLRASMDFFDSSNDGNRIDYNSFVRFFKYKEPELPSAVKKMQSLVFGRKSIDVFRRFDSSGTGYVKRAEMIIGLNDLGYGHIAQLIILNMLRMFEIRIEGQVDYANFVETVRENDASQALDALSLKFFVLVTSNMNSIDDEASFREWFNKMDKLRQGKFMVQHLAEFLSLQNISYPNEIVLALYNEMDAEGFGVPFSSYVKWIINYYKFSQVAGAESASYSNLSLSEIQRKTSLYRTVFMADSNAAYGIDSIVHSFAIYDWCRQDDGAIGKPLFFRGAKRVGFPFTSHELRVLAAEFAYQHNPEKVSYKHFLSWATQSPVAGSAQDSKALVPVETVKRTSGTTIKFLEKALQRGIDLLSVFGRFDSLSVGRITANEFCAVLADLGLSNVTQREALELADRFRAAVGDYILYRKIVTELLRQADELSGAADVDIVDVLKSALQNSQTDLYRLKDIFVYYDRKGNGTVSEDDLYTIFEEAKLRIRKTEVMAVADKFSVGKSASIQYGPLLRALESRLTEKLPAGRLAIGKLPEEIAMKLKSLFEQLILRGKDYRGEFDKFDETFSGCINQLDFREVLENRLGAKFSAKDIEVLEKVFRSSSDPRKLNFTKMIYMTHPRNYGRVPFDNIDSTGAAWEVAEDLRQKIRRRYEFMTPGELRRPYRHFARRKGINNVNLEDFALAIRNLGLRIAGDQERAVFNMINVTGGDAFRYNDFVVFVCDPQHLDLIWKLRRSIAKARVSEREIISALNDQDSNSSGLITAKQFSRAMKSCSIELSDSDIMRLLLRFDSEDSQRFDIEKFIKFLHGRSEEEEFLENDEVERSRGSARSLRSSVGKSTEKYVFEALKEKVEAKLDVGLTPNQIFALFDPDEKGILDIVSLQYGARELGMTVTRADMRSVLRRMSLLIGGAVTRKSFFEGLGVDLDQYSDPDFTKSKRARLRNLEDEDDLGYRFDGRLNDDLKPRRRDIDDDLHSTRRKRYDDSADDIFDNENQLNSALANVAVQVATAILYHTFSRYYLFYFRFEESLVETVKSILKR